MDYRNWIKNKQITLDSVKKIADYLEDLKEDYNKKFEIDDRKNKNLEYSKKSYEYGLGECKLVYEIEFNNGENIKQENYNWFVSCFEQAKEIKYMGIHFDVQFERSGIDVHTNEKIKNYNSITLNLDLKSNEVYIRANEMGQEDSANRIYNDIMSFLQENDDKWNKTIKHRKIKTFMFCTSIGIIITYVIYVILKLNIFELSYFILKLLEEKMFVIIGQWIVAVILGYLFSKWYISNLYKTIMPKQIYSGYNQHTGRNEYKDNVESFVNEPEVHIGKYWDAKRRREKIEKISFISKNIVFIQLIISVVLLIILK